MEKDNTISGLDLPQFFEEAKKIFEPRVFSIKSMDVEYRYKPSTGELRLCFCLFYKRTKNAETTNWSWFVFSGGIYPKKRTLDELLAEIKENHSEINIIRKK